MCIWVLGDPNFQRKKEKEKKRSSTAWQGLIEHVQTIKISPKNGVDILTFVRETCVICVVALFLHSFDNRINYVR